ncbi:hypothetical protein BBJ28_00012105 [Nothophytophthora sp. Chile5]|nr:hypothetical protein BBJ28_00012105 [Nothophytophthora sp. Chile5]
MAKPDDTARSLNPTVQERLDELKLLCRAVCVGGESDAGTEAEMVTAVALREIRSGVQLWKERSLHCTLEALDSAGTPSMERHIQAMEHHEKAARDLLELLLAFLQRTWRELHRHVDVFAGDLAHLFHEILTSKLDEQRSIHDEVVRVLEDDKQRLGSTCQEVQSANESLAARLEAIETAPEGGGDALLCNKLRSRVHHLSIRQRELSTELERMSQERLRHRREMATTQMQLAASQKALVLTRAMQDKETKQLAALVQLSHSQMAQVLDASRSLSSPSQPQQAVARFDPLSGRTIVHESAAMSPLKPPSSPTPRPARLASSLSLSSPNQKVRGVQQTRQPTPLQARQRPERPRSAASAASRWSSRVGDPDDGKAASSSNKLGSLPLYM